MLPGRSPFTRLALFHRRHRDRKYHNLGTERGLGLRKKRVFGWQDGDHDHLPRAERSVLFTWLLLRSRVTYGLVQFSDVRCDSHG